MVGLGSSERKASQATAAWAEMVAMASSWGSERPTSAIAGRGAPGFLVASRFVAALTSGGASFFFLLEVVEPPGVGHGGAGRDHADPGAVGGLGEKDGDVEAASEDGEAGDVVDVLVGDEDGVEKGGVFADERHAAE